MPPLYAWAITMAILSVNCKTETERVTFKIIAVLCLIIPFFMTVVGTR